MRILVQTPLKNEEIKRLLCETAHDGIAFTFVGKQGIALVFDATGAAAEQAIEVAKSCIKSTDWGKILYFSIVEG